MLSRPLFTVAFAAGLVLAGSFASAQQWRKHTYAADGFAVDFFGEVKIDPTEVAPGSKDRIVRSTNYLQDEGSAAYIVGATLARYSVEFDKGVTASFNALQCKTKTSDTPLNFPSGKAREITGTDCTGDGSLAVEARYFQVGNWFYQVMAIIGKGQDKEQARRFVTSFSSIEGAKE